MATQPSPYRALRLWRDLRGRDDGKRRHPNAWGNDPCQCRRVRRHQACAGHPLGDRRRCRRSDPRDNIGFRVGREFGEPLLEKWGHLVGLDARKRMLGRYLFARCGGLIVFFGRFVALLRAFAALRLGAALNEACLGSIALGAPFVLQRKGSIDHAKIGIWLWAIEKMPPQCRVWF
jgi:hypothetical protein